MSGGPAHGGRRVCANGREITGEKDDRREEGGTPEGRAPDESDEGRTRIAPRSGQRTHGGRKGHRRPQGHLARANGASSTRHAARGCHADDILPCVRTARECRGLDGAPWRKRGVEFIRRADGADRWRYVRREEGREAEG